MSVHIAAGAGILAALCAAPAELWANPVYRVQITSKPAGATLWIDDRTGDAAGQTPYDGRLPEGKHTIFIEREGYEFAVHEVTVRKRRKGPQRFSFDLVELRSGSVDVISASGSADAEGATVLIDGKEVGTVPDTFEVTEGAHHVEVIKSEGARFEQWIEVVKGERIEISVTLSESTAAPASAAASTTTEPAIKGTSAPRDRYAPMLIVEAGLGSGWRSFEYENALNEEYQRPYAASGIALADLGAELRLGALVDALRWFSVFGGVSMALPLSSSTENGNEEITTRWLRHEVGVRGRVAVGPAWIGLDVVHAGSSFTFQDPGALAEKLPDAQYQYLRVGGGAGVALGKSAAGVGADHLVMLDTRGLSERFGDATVSGLRVHGWLRHRVLENIEAALIASYTGFDYTLVAAGLYDADGGHDRMIDLVVNAAYRF